MSEIDSRIQSLTQEFARLRDSTKQADDQLHTLLLKLTAIQLNLATQDRTLDRLDHAVNGNGKPGLLLRVDRIEGITGALAKSVWLLTTAAVAAVGRFIFERLK